VVDDFDFYISKKFMLFFFLPLGILCVAMVDDFVFYHDDDVDFAFEGVDS
jgi:hypothetical protein